MPFGLDAVGTAGGTGFVEDDGSGGGGAAAYPDIELEAIEDCISLGASYLQISILSERRSYPLTFAPLPLSDDIAQLASELAAPAAVWVRVAWPLGVGSPSMPGPLSLAAVSG